MDWGEPATCVEGYYPVPAYPPEYMCTYDCCATVPDGYDYEEPEDCSAKHGSFQGRCDADDACEWVDSWDSCQTACSLFTEDWACDGGYCSWSYEDGVCETSCSSLSEDACDAEPMCEFIDSWDSCQTACSLFTEDWACRDDYCSWSYEDGVCEAGCGILSEDECDADGSLCQWIDSWHSCQTACSQFEEWQCRDDYCSWDYEDGVCETGCRVLSGEDECAADGACQWASAWSECRDVCWTKGQWECSDHCAWNGDSCEMKCEAKHGDYDSCASDDSCLYYQAWQHCGEICGWDTGETCDWNHECTAGWYGHNAESYYGCEPKCDAMYQYDYDACVSDSRCHWDNGYSCENYIANCENNGEGCWWDWYHEEDEDDDDGGDMTGLLLSAVGVASAATTLGGLAVAMVANAAQGQCALGPTVGHAAGGDEPFYVAPQLCTIDGETFASDETVTGRTARKACKAYCSAAGLLVKKLELATCYCRKRR